MSPPAVPVKYESPPALGGVYLGDGRARFHLWAPFAESVELKTLSPRAETIPMNPAGDGYVDLILGDASPGLEYQFRLNGKTARPDPASRFQRKGVHGPSTLIDPEFSWTDSSWKGIDLTDFVFYEIHVGTFSKKADFSGVIDKLSYLKDLGVTAVEIMPVAQFPGNRNWGYDGVYPFAVQNSYGGPEGLKKLVDACHSQGLAVVLDVVYNHLGPEGNYLNEFGPYFTDHYRTPWGRALNFDAEWNHHVRRFFIENALMWVTDYHIDGLRLDAIHAICDFSAYPFLKELGEAVHKRGVELGRKAYLFPESDLNDSKIVRPHVEGGFNLDAQWNDDFHHALHALLTTDRSGYYADFGTVDDLTAAYRRRYVYDGRYSRYRKRPHGNDAEDVPSERFIVFSQNHDQVGNRMRGDRLAAGLSFEALKLAAGCVVLSPYLPLFFMGEEYGETAPFHYFISHTDPLLLEAVRKGRREEFRAFGWMVEPPDPQSPSTFEACRLDFNRLEGQRGSVLHEYYKVLLDLRKSNPALGSDRRIRWSVEREGNAGIVAIRSRQDGHETLQIMNFENSEVSDVKRLKGRRKILLNSSEARWMGPGSEGLSPFGFLVLTSKE